MRRPESRHCRFRRLSGMTDGQKQRWVITETGICCRLRSTTGTMNITAVAKRAGVSTATVSRVMNGTANVSPDTAERVREAVEALNFYPDVNARALGSGRSGLYGLIISDITNPYFPELVKAFEDIAVEHGRSEERRVGKE